MDKAVFMNQVCSMHYLISTHTSPASWVGVRILILQIRFLRLREVKTLAQSHTVSSTEISNSIINQQNLIHIHKTLRSTTAEYTFFSSAQRTYTKIDHIFSHKKNANQFVKIEILTTA